MLRATPDGSCYTCSLYSASEGQCGSDQWSSLCCALNPYWRVTGNPEVPCSVKATEGKTLGRGQVLTTSLGTALAALDGGGRGAVPWPQISTVARTLHQCVQLNMDSYAEGLSRAWCRVSEKSAVTDYCSLDSSTRVFVLTVSPTSVI